MNIDKKSTFLDYLPPPVKLYSDKSKVEISQSFVAISEYMNFKHSLWTKPKNEFLKKFVTHLDMI